ncbi:vWA domain-containing protein [Deinococcus altitudinis]|uniref:vWA domain-containing protein n=1 Tax=Deinococcus altitudinis TaxID=468914 RepID=UPI003892ABE2
MSELSASLTEFARSLRSAGLKVGPGETADALRAMTLLETLDPVQMQDALRMVLTAHQHEREVFDAAFRDHFLLRGAADQELRPLGVKKPASPNPPAPKDERSGPPREQEGEGEGQQTQNRRQQGQGEDQEEGEGQTLRSRLSPHAARQEPGEGYGGDLEDLLHAASALIRRVRLGRSRRWRAMPKGGRFDFRRTLRASLRTGGDPVSVRYQGHPRRAPRFLIVIDGSRSMEPHAALLLRYAAALMLRSRRVEVYSFSTGLTRLTPTLRHSLGVRAGERGAWSLRLPDLGEGWGGGTRIGDNLLRLTRDERARLTPDTVTVVLSDGLDTGEPEVLARAVRELARQSGRLIWLNPLAGIPGYLPIARGMAAALPYLDVFAAADDVAALERLPGKLKG